MNANIETQIKELAKGMVKPLNEIDNLMDEYHLCLVRMDCAGSSGPHFEAECEFNSVNDDKEYYEKEITIILKEIYQLTGDKEGYSDPASYLKIFIEIPESIQEIFEELL